MELHEFNREWRAELIFKHAYADFSVPYLDFKHLKKHKRGRKPTCNCEHKACARVQLCHLLPPGHLFLRENMILSGVKTLPLVTFTAALPLDSLLPHQPIYFYAPWFGRPGAGYSDNRDAVHPDTWGWSHTMSHNLGGKPQMSAMFSFIRTWVSVKPLLQWSVSALWVPPRDRWFLLTVQWAQQCDYLNAIIYATACESWINNQLGCNQYALWYIIQIPKLCLSRRSNLRNCIQSGASEVTQRSFPLCILIFAFIYSFSYFKYDIY